jgi:hypothetical protein
MTFTIAITAYFILSIAVVISLRIQLRNAIKLAHAHKLMYLMSERASLDISEYHATSDEADAIDDQIEELDNKFDEQVKYISIDEARKLTEQGDK